MVNKLYLTYYLLINSFAFLFALIACNYGRYQQNPLNVIIITILGIFFSLSPLLFSRSMIAKDFTSSSSSLPKKLQILPQFYRFLILFMIPFMLLTLLPRDYKVIFTLINYFALILILQTVLFPFGTDDLSCRLMSTTILLILSGYSSTKLTWMLSIIALTFMLSSITIFLLMHQYNKQQQEQVRQILKLTSIRNLFIFGGAGILALLTTLILFSILPRSFIKDLPGKSVSLEMLIPKLFNTGIVGLVMYSVISLAVILLLFHMLSKYFKPKKSRHGVMLGDKCIIDAENIDMHDWLENKNDWEGARKVIISNYLNIRKLLKKYGFNLRDSMTPNEVSTKMGKKIKDLKTDLERLTRIFNWARYSKSKPTQNETEVSMLLKTNIKHKINSFFKE